MCDATDSFLEAVWAWGESDGGGQVIPLCDGSGEEALLYVGFRFQRNIKGHGVTVTGGSNLWDKV